MTNPRRPDPGPTPGYNRPAHWAAVLAALTTLPLLYVGGSVTTYRVGLAVPDWPTTFGMNMFLYNFWNSSFGVVLEHSHRLYGAYVGALTIALCVCLFAMESRRWLKVLGVVTLLMVVVQGLLGGFRVTQISTTWAAIHGCLAQVFFATLVSMAVFTGRDWMGDAPATPDRLGIRRLSTATLGLMTAQIGLGAWIRHFSGQAAATFHAVVGVALLGVAAHLFVRIRRNEPAKPSLRASARLLEVLAGVQILLGLASFVFLWPFDGYPRPVGFYQAVVRTLHQTNGAVLLAAAVTTALKAHRHLGPTADAADPAPSPSPSQPVDLEVVA